MSSLSCPQPDSHSREAYYWFSSQFKTAFIKRAIFIITMSTYFHLLRVVLECIRTINRGSVCSKKKKIIKILVTGAVHKTEEQHSFMSWYWHLLALEEICLVTLNNALMIFMGRKDQIKEYHIKSGAKFGYFHKFSKERVRRPCCWWDVYTITF